MAAKRNYSDYTLRWAYAGLTRMGGRAFAQQWAELITPHHLALATAAETPRYTGLASAEVRTLANRLRRTLNEAPQIGCALYSDAFLVSPSDWPADIKETFLTDDPPTPRDMAAYIFSRRGGAGRAGQGMATVEKMVLCWWLLGLPLAALDARAYLGYSASVYLHNAVYALLQRPVFRLWSVGDDLAPLMDSDAMTKSIPYILGRMRGTTPDTRTYSQYMHEAVNGPYMRAIESRRAAIRPTRRVLPDLPVTFASVEDKQAALMGNPNAAEALQTSRNAIVAAFGPFGLPDYATFTPLMTPWRSNAPQS